MNLINDDCVKVMESMPSSSIDCLFTSPPFKEEDVDGDYWEFYSKFFLEAIRVTKRIMFIIHSSTKLLKLIEVNPPQRILIWGKEINRCSYRYNPILCYYLDGQKWNKYIWSDAFGIPPIIPNKYKFHKYQDPVILYETILKMAKRGGCVTVMDPFMGSGTTGVACNNLGMDFMGIEIDKEIFRKTENHLLSIIKDVKTQSTLFGGDEKVDG